MKPKTYKQWKQGGRQVIRGEKAHWIDDKPVFYKHQTKPIVLSSPEDWDYDEYGPFGNYWDYYHIKD